MFDRLDSTRFLSALPVLPLPLTPPAHLALIGAVDESRRRIVSHTPAHSPIPVNFYTPIRNSPPLSTLPRRAYSPSFPTFPPPTNRNTFSAPHTRPRTKTGDGAMELSDQTGNYAAAAAGPSRPRHNLAIPRAPRAPRTGIHAEVPIDLTLDESSDEDDMVVTGANVVAPGPPRPLIQRFSPPPMAEARRPRVNYDDDEFHDEFEALDRAMHRHGRNVDAFLAAEQDRRREPSPPPPPPALRQRIGLGGAVMRTGARQINFDAQRNRRQVIAAPLARHHSEPRSPSPPRRYPPPRRNMYQPPPPMEQPRNADLGWLGGPFQQRLMDYVGLGGRFFGGAGGGGMNDERAAQVAAAMGLHVRPPGGGTNVEEKTANVPTPIYPDPLPGFTNSFDLESLPGPIVVDDNGDVDKPITFFVCASCEDPLLVSGAYESSADRVWALRCGHLLDQKCLDRSSIPTTPDQVRRIINYTAGGLPILGDEAPKKKRRPSKRHNTKPSVFPWSCPVEGCRREHCSEKRPDQEVWLQTEESGALAAFM